MFDSDGKPYDPSSDGWVPDAAGGFMTLIGPVWRKSVDDVIRFGMLAQQKHANHRGIVHGGAIMSFADYAVGMSMVAQSGNINQVTIQLDVNFVSAALMGDFITGWGEVVRRTSSVMFLRGTIEAPGRVVATVQGIWKIVRPLNQPGGPGGITEQEQQ